MENDKHTPGPWTLMPWRDPLDGPGDPQEMYIGRTEANHAGKHVARLSGWGYDYTSDPEQQANARLIAAAPDLLDALRFAFENLVMAERIVSDAGHVTSIPSAIRKAGDAIAKATGEA